MSTFNWESFLRRWSQEILESIADNQEKLPSEVIRSGWLGYPGATNEQITRAEDRLGIALPPSYRAFLKVSNGWRQTTPFIPRLWSTEEIEWFTVRHQDWINAFLDHHEHPSTDSPNSGSAPTSVSDAEYFVYGDDQDCSKIRFEYLQTALEISAKGDYAIYLLNPKAIAADGEWEAWFFGDWLPGADRYRSFCEMMQAEYENFLELRETPSQRAVKVIAADAEEQPDPANEHNELFQHVIEPPMSVVAEEISSREDSDWHPLTSLSVEFQSRHIGGLMECQTIARHAETNAVTVWSGIELEQLQPWILDQITVEMPPGADQEISLAKPPVTAEITQLRVMPYRWMGKPLVADKTHHLFPDAIKAGEPFVLEVSLKLAGLVAAKVAKQQLTYRTQCYARHLSTGAVINLGDIVTNVAMGSQSSYIALLPDMTLRQPGAYRLKVLVTPQSPSASSASFKVPMLQVM